MHASVLLSSFRNRRETNLVQGNPVPDSAANFKVRSIYTFHKGIHTNTDMDLDMDLDLVIDIEYILHMCIYITHGPP